MEILKKSGGEENVKRGRACRSNDKCGHVSQHLHIAMGLIPCPRHMPCFPVILRPLLFFPLKLPYNSTQQEKGGGKKKKEKEERERERESAEMSLTSAGKTAFTAPQVGSYGTFFSQRPVAKQQLMSCRTPVRAPGTVGVQRRRLRPHRHRRWDLSIGPKPGNGR